MGAVRLLRRDRERRALLVERARPGNDISELPEDDATAMRPDVTERRIAAFAAAGLDEYRIRAWTIIRGVYLGADEDEVQVRALL